MSPEVTLLSQGHDTGYSTSVTSSDFRVDAQDMCVVNRSEIKFRDVEFIGSIDGVRVQGNSKLAMFELDLDNPVVINEGTKGMNLVFQPGDLEFKIT